MIVQALPEVVSLQLIAVNIIVVNESEISFQSFEGTEAPCRTAASPSNPLQSSISKSSNNVRAFSSIAGVEDLVSSPSIRARVLQTPVYFDSFSFPCIAYSPIWMTHRFAVHGNRSSRDCFTNIITAITTQPKEVFDYRFNECIAKNKMPTKFQ